MTAQRIFVGLIMLSCVLGLRPIRAAQPASSTQTIILGASAEDQQIVDLQQRVSRLENPGARVGIDFGGVSFLFGVFCALWAQNTGRGPWLWFFLGFFFTAIAAIVLLVKNANDRRRLLWHEREKQFHPPGSAPVYPPPN